jgi:hypothetical protein
MLYPRSEDKLRIAACAKAVDLPQTRYVLQAVMDRVRDDERKFNLKPKLLPSFPTECRYCGKPVTLVNARRAHNEGRLPVCRDCQRNGKPRK